MVPDSFRRLHHRAVLCQREHGLGRWTLRPHLQTDGRDSIRHHFGKSWRHANPLHNGRKRGLGFTRTNRDSQKRPHRSSGQLRHNIHHLRNGNGQNDRPGGTDVGSRWRTSGRILPGLHHRVGRWTRRRHSQDHQRRPDLDSTNQRHDQLHKCSPFCRCQFGLGRWTRRKHPIHDRRGHNVDENRLDQGIVRYCDAHYVIRRALSESQQSMGSGYKRRNHPIRFDAIDSKKEAKPTYTAG